MIQPSSVGGDRQHVRISSGSDRVVVIAEDRIDVEIDGRAEIEREGTRTTIVASGRVVVRVPELTDVIIGATTSRVEVEGRMGSVAIVTESGRINVEQATNIDARSTSGRIVIGDLADACCARTISGSVTVSSCGAADVSTESGRISLEGVRGPVHAHCVSGRIDIELDQPNDVDAETVSGRIVVSLPRGARDDGAHGVQTRSVSGRVDVRSR